MAGAAPGEASLEATASWAVAIVCTGLVIIALLIEHILHLSTAFVKRRKRKALIQAVDQIKSELRNLGFMSLLLTVAKQPVSKICIPRHMADTFLPCKTAPTSDEEDVGSCKEGKVPLVPSDGTQDLQMLILMLAAFHVVSCLLTLFLGEIKMRSWKSWEKETKTLEYQLSHDSRRFKLIRQTSFGKQHLKFWNHHWLLLWIVCFLRQFVYSISRADYFALRHAFVRVHLVKDMNFDFHKYLQRTLDQDFVMAVKSSFWNWTYAVLFIFFNAHVFYKHFWLPFIPLLLLLAIGTKLELIINQMCLKSSEQVDIVQGIIRVNPDNVFFWFSKPRLLLHIIQFILIQNSFQLAFFAWTWYKFGARSCFHEDISDIVLSIGVSLVVQLLCAYVTLPLYALVTQMGTSGKETVFTERVVEGLKNWHNSAKRSLAASSAGSSSPMQTLASPPEETPLSEGHIPSAPHFEYPSGRLELLEIQKVVGEIVECNGSNTSSQSELSFRLWWKKEITSQGRYRK